MAHIEESQCYIRWFTELLLSTMLNRLTIFEIRSERCFVLLTLLHGQWCTYRQGCSNETGYSELLKICNFSFFRIPDIKSTLRECFDDKYTVDKRKNAMRGILVTKCAIWGKGPMVMRWSSTSTLARIMNYRDKSFLLGGCVVVWYARWTVVVTSRWSRVHSLPAAIPRRPARNLD